ncbi:hypothetical protein LVD15_24500 [Fulvivirga maritima]|uniref:hypothetical protein n=1 Tax=Fulvivirga maritima TaxID=2904247 RepID=UPI001F30E44E|nr:hypothetical protein [Fulvivirga maritima]UII26419.1 hypothetical protein LVD15_24500 [Fulvivirga maritima]
MNTLERKNYLKDKLKHTGCSQEELSELYFLIQKHGSDSEWEALLKAEWESQPLHELSDQEAQNMLRRLKRKINSP